VNDRIVRASWAGTAVFSVTAIAGAIAPHQLSGASFAVAVALFVVGCIVFLRSLVLAAGRSRTESIDVTGLYFLTGDVAPAVRGHLLGSLVVEATVAFTTAAVRPYTILAAGVLAPVYGLGLCGLWAARFGKFPPR